MTDRVTELSFEELVANAKSTFLKDQQLTAVGAAWSATSRTVLPREQVSCLANELQLKVHAPNTYRTDLCRRVLNRLKIDEEVMAIDRQRAECRTPEHV